ncbi:Werner Syndrome-like exonuclease [Micractinium conductrix]|uniref:Werner Syndrome-like exonuclease n=1 Tax=Micractinium conductrix TaxID=554055 RepID=A0A2P6VCA8_9CHLO|nr:Werner Syndrome-like exonuclease [Micractinium conductrix]|eukprot:PSC71691.1 Werner Syndrome-like exonuclease [Micractinium conductrix]
MGPAAEAVAAAPHACGAPSTAAGSPSSSGGTPSASLPAGAPRPPKSAKRRAAEALLHRRFSSSPSVAALAAADATEAAKRRRGDDQQTAQPPAEQQQQQQRPPVRVAACSDCSAAEPAWCTHDVALPPLDWAAVLQSVQHEHDVPICPSTQAHCLPGSIRVHVVSRVDQLPAALGALRSSMQDACVAIDLEWKPEGWQGAGPSRVALMQLASGTTAVLVRVSSLGYRMPPPLHDFLSDPELSFVGFSWDSADEQKMRATFGWGRDVFARFVDLQQVGESLGYHGLGLGALTRQVLGFQPPKDRKVTMSNWEARHLSAKQVQYAALDAIITGHVYRGLRLWHASPSACTACRQMLGKVLPAPEWRCHDCDRSFNHRGALLSHRTHTKHRVSAGVCNECGRVHAK